ncbi:hypothetical protein JK359_33235 [Streptomyces actinomycinicus]|uniref:Uncharacterized protein n=1 Tax=Streptomyces actinomycinicus TaxID=1695166 RepID=A0A937JSH5_9ACTN|nr:hypothetical protein [Streptomyces actinomycinicus]MBL1086772.1 hypothetical protein [Streptomyces actinomycinicus]
MKDVADLALALSVVTALRVFGPGGRTLIRRLLGASVRIGAESLAEQRTAYLATDAAPGTEEKGSRR